MLIIDIVHQLLRHDAYITVKDHKESFPHNSSFRIINPSKSTIDKVSKSILDQMNKEITSSIHVNQWKNTSAVIKWFINIENIKNIENTPNCSLIIFDIQDFYLSISLSLFTKLLNLKRKSTNYQMMKFPSLCNQEKHYYSVMVNHGLKKMTRMILMYQWAATMEQRCAS